MSVAHPLQEALKLVDGKNGRRRIIDRLGQGFERNVDQIRNANIGSCSIVRSDPKATAAPQLARIDRASAAV